MKRVIVILGALGVAYSLQGSLHASLHAPSLAPLHSSLPGAADKSDKEVAAWERRARNVTIMRDNWGIPHVYGKTDADAVFGVMYAQAEDDFNRVETNYINGMGRLAEAEGDSQVYRDLRMKLSSILTT